MRLEVDALGDAVLNVAMIFAAAIEQHTTARRAVPTSAEQSYGSAIVTFIIQASFAAICAARAQHAACGAHEYGV